MPKGQGLQIAISCSSFSSSFAEVVHGPQELYRHGHGIPSQRGDYPTIPVRATTLDCVVERWEPFRAVTGLSFDRAIQLLGPSLSFPAPLAILANGACLYGGSDV